MIVSRTLGRLGPVTLALASLTCGGGGSPTQPVATPTPTPIPIPTVTPVVSEQCGNLAPGPVVRYAIAPRTQMTDGVQVPIRVWIQAPWQEAWCIDKDKEHRLDFNSNQRNADGKESCFVNDPVWRVAEDPDGVVLGQGAFGEHGFNYRIGVNARGLETSIGIQAQIDGVPSKPWQSGPTTGYPEGPLRIVTMSAQDIQKFCKCTYFGNGNYNPECTDR